MIAPKYKGLLQLFPLEYYWNMNLRPGCLIFLFPLWAAFAGGGTESLRPSLPAPERAGIPSAAGEAVDATQRNRGETVLKAMASAYPDRVEKVEFLDGDWTILVYGERFFFTGGRLLPASLRDEMNEYAPQSFYNYEKELPPWVRPTEEESARIMEQQRLRETRQAKRSPHFYETLWRSRNRDEAWEHIKQIRFSGIPVQVHYSILVNLSLVEEQILRTAKTNSTVRQWINNLGSVTGWEWRNIASSQNRSYHAYGAAIDFIPKSYGGLEAYWLWTARVTPEWWNVPYSRRFHPPDEVIKTFESFGFIWGGKWRYYDTIHFEYRPEILVLSGIPQMDPRDLR